MVQSDSALLQLVDSILNGDAAGVSRRLAANPQLASAVFQAGATRQAAEEFFLDRIKRYIYAGDTALHIAAAANQEKLRVSC
jgi:hypothetical protein